MKPFIRTTTQLSLRLFLLIGLLAGLLGVSGTTTIASASGPAIVIDDFNTGAFSVSGPSGYNIDLPASGAIGGVRDISISDSGTPLTPSIMTLTPGNGYLNLAVGNLPGNYQIGWGSLLFSGGTELNLNASSHDRIVVTLSQAPSSGVISVKIQDSLDVFLNTYRHASLPLNGMGDYTFLFSSFGGFSHSDIAGIAIVLDQGVSAGFTVRFESIIITSAPCPAGQFDNGSGCVDASPGYYVPAPGATEQTPCAPGMYQPNAGSVSCIPASPGHYVDVTAAAMPIDCLPGSYQPNSSATSCLLADAGFFVSETAAIEQFVCPRGTTSLAGATDCTLAFFNFSGFLQPVDNLPALNQVKAGQGIPVKFSLGGDQGLNILASGSPSSMRVVCDGSAAIDAIEQTVTTGGSSLSYDATTNTYTYVWKTEKSWANTCRQLMVTLTDGTVHEAQFKFK
jgi:hypothetical protein